MEIHPVFHTMLDRKEKESLLGQRANVIWLTGLSGSGKSTIAVELEKQLFEMDFITMILDGDNLRSGVNNDLDFSDEGRKENIRRQAEIAKLFLNNGIIVITSVITPTEELREFTRSIIGKENMIEVFVNSSLEVCEQRDTKGLYAKARSGELQEFTGISSPFEPPLNPDLELDTEKEDVETSVDNLLNFVLPKIVFKN